MSTSTRSGGRCEVPSDELLAWGETRAGWVGRRIRATAPARATRDRSVGAGILAIAQKPSQARPHTETRPAEARPTAMELSEAVRRAARTDARSVPSNRRPIDPTTASRTSAWTGSDMEPRIVPLPVPSPTPCFVGCAAVRAAIARRVLAQDREMSRVHEVNAMSPASARRPAPRPSLVLHECGVPNPVTGCPVAAARRPERPRPLRLPGPFDLRIVASRDDSPACGPKVDSASSLGTSHIGR